MNLKHILPVFLLKILIAVTSANEISQIQISSTNYMIREKSNLTISFIYNLDLNSEVQIILDEKFPDFSEGFSCMNNLKTCACLEKNRTILITDCFGPLNIARLTITNLSTPLYSGSAFFSVFILKSGKIDGYKNTSLVLKYSPQGLTATLSCKDDEANKFSIWSLNLDLKYELEATDEVQITSPTKCSSSFSCSMPEAFNCKCLNSKITFSLKVSQGLKFSLEFDSIQNPPTTGKTSGILIETVSAFGVIQRDPSSSILITRGSLVHSESSLSGQRVNQNSSLYIEFFCNNIIPEHSDLLITFPIELEIFEDTSIMGIFGVSSFLDPVFIEKNASLTECFESSWPENKNIAFQTRVVRNPSTTRPVDGYLTVSKGGSVYCEGKFQVVTKTGVISFQVAAEDLTINAFTRYYLKVGTDFEWNGVCLAIWFPSGFGLGSSRCDGCLIDEQSISISDVKGFAFEVIVNDVKNYHLTSETGVFIVKTLTSCRDGYEIERNETVSLVMKPGKFSASLEASSYVTGDFSTYVFEMNISNSLPALGSIILTFPNSLRISNLQQGLKNIQNLNRFHNLLLTSSSINISKAVSEDFTGTVRFSLDDIQNPASLEPVEIKWFTSYEGHTQDLITYSFKMMTAHLFKSISVSSDSYVVGKLSSYQITIFPYNQGFDQVTLNFGYNIGDVFSDVLAESFNNSVVLNHPESASRISFKLFNVTNPFSTKPENILINSYKNGFLSDSDVFEFTADTPGELLISLPSQVLKISSSFTLNLNIFQSNKFESPGYLILNYPSLTGSCLEQEPIESCSFFKDSIKISLSKFTSPLSLTLQNLSSELFSGLYSYSLCSYTNEYLVDCQLLNLSFTCEVICKSCSFLPSNCTSCHSSTFLYNNTCSSECLESFYKNQSVCEACQSPCVTCSSSKTCKSCSSLFPYFFNDFCYKTCPDGSFPTSSYNCTECVESCLLCTSLNTCQSCRSGFVNYLFNCVLSCPSGFYEKLGVCLRCMDNCGKCADDKNCQECFSGYFLYNGSCLNTCPEGITVAIKQICVYCETRCKTCYQGPENCASCSSPLNLYESNCLSECPQGFYSYLNTCQRCSSQCLTCSQSSFSCLSCSSPLNLFESSCVETCPVGLLPMNQVCKCSEGCKSCNDSGCLTCERSLKLYKGTCLDSCPPSTFESSSSCIPCIVSCSSCSNLSSCDSCMSGFLLYESNCYSSCPNQTFASEDACVACPSACVECESQEICTLCEASYLLFNSTCVQHCPAGHSEFLSACVPDSSECSENCTFTMSKDQHCDWTCYVKACGFDSDRCPPKNYSDSLAIDQVPVPISMTGGVGVAVAGVSAVMFGSSFIAVAGPLCSLLETAAGLGLLVTVGLSDGTRGRELLRAEDSKTSAIFVILFILNVLHVFGNLAFVFCFFKWIFPNDPEVRSWYRDFKCAGRTVLLLCALISYKFFRITWSGLFKLKVCSLSLKNHRNLWTLMKFLHVFMIFFIELPIAAVCVYIFWVYSKGSYAFIVALDSLVVVSLVIILTLWEIFELRQKEESVEKKNPTFPTETIDIDHRTYIEEAKSRTDQSTDRRLNYFWKGEK